MFLKLTLITLPLLLALDALWLGLIAKNFYQKEIGLLMKTEINWIAAFAFYVLFVIGLVNFVIIPAIEKGSWVHSLSLGALFGLICYATYDLTNLATFKDWPLSVTIVDMIWGAVIASTVSSLTTVIALHFGIK